MGLLDNILGKGEAAPSSGGKNAVFSLSNSFRPMRLAARADNSIELLVDIQSLTDEAQLCSIVVEVPKGIGFDGVGIHKTKEMRIGQLPGHEKKSLAIGLHGSSQTPPGIYRIQLTAYSHYRDYSHVLNSVSKPIELRVV